MSNFSTRVYRVKAKPIPRYFSFVASMGIISILSTLIYFIGGFEESEAAATCTSGEVSDVTIAGTTTHILTFTANSTTTDGNCTFTVPDNVYAVDYLVVAGGGGGNSGGGGAGGLATSWAVRNEADTATVAARQTPLSVFPEDSITVTVGIGGTAGSGGAPTDWETTLTVGTNGRNSVFGSITSTGGGAGGFGYGCQGGDGTTACPGGSMSGAQGGSGGGSAYDFTGTSNPASIQTEVVGATSLGNRGGTSGGSGGYRAGSGGGGAGTAGGAARRTPNDSPHQASNSTHQHAGGNGGDGVSVNITGTATVYACGGGGGINDNEGNNTARNYGTVDGFGAAGCAGAGQGSNRVVDSRLGTGRNNYFNGTVQADLIANRGHGGGGTDPESTVAGPGGSGVVILRYTIPHELCPNEGGAQPASLPVACPTTISVTAGNTTYRELDMRGQPYSFSDTSTSTLALISFPTNMDVLLTSDSRTVRIRVLPETNTLISGTYPVVYELQTSGSTASESYILVNVIDPGQRTPLHIPVDPRANFVDLPSLIVGNINASQVCLTNETNTATYPNPPTITITNEGNETRTALTRGGLRIRGTNAVVQRSTNFIRVTAPNGENLLNSGVRRRINVNVSNTATGGNGSCSFGTASTITLVPLEISQVIRQGIVEGNKRGG